MLSIFLDNFIPSHGTAIRTRKKRNKLVFMRGSHDNDNDNDNDNGNDLVHH